MSPLEQSRNRALEMMAEGRPLPEILAQLAAMVEGECPGVSCSIAIAGDVEAPENDGTAMPITSGAGALLGTLVIRFEGG